MTNISSQSPSAQNINSNTEFVDGKIVVTETKVSEYDPQDILADLEKKLADQIDAKKKAIESNDEIISELQAQIQEIKSKANL